MTLRELYDDRRQGRSDMAAHLPVLVEYAAHVRHATEFGLGAGNSTVGLLYGLAHNGGTLVSYDCDPCTPTVAAIRGVDPWPAALDWHVLHGDTRQIRPIGTTDLLLVDTVHTAEQVYAELLRHACRVRHYLVFHDTVTCGERDLGQPGSPLGLLWGIGRYCHEHPTWRCAYSSDSDHGLRIYERLDDDD